MTAPTVGDLPAAPSERGSSDSTASTAGFPRLSDQTLAAFEQMATPLDVYCFDRERIIWANSAGLKLWRATSLSELRNRPLGPFSAATRARQVEYLTAFRRGEGVDESWTFYPKEIPTASHCRLSGVSLIDAPRCMLVEHLVPARDLPREEVRSIEAMRHMPLVVSMHAPSGALLMRNPTALARFGPEASPYDPAIDAFSAMFTDPALGRDLLTEALACGQAAKTAEMNCAGRPTHRVDVVKVTDPVSGAPAILVHQQDITEMLEAESALAASEMATTFALGFNDAPVLVFSASSCEVLRTNAAAERLLTDACKLDLRHLFAVPDDLSAIRTDLVEGRTSSWQVLLRHPDGPSFWACITGQLVAQSHTAVIVLIVTVMEHSLEPGSSQAGPFLFEQRMEAVNAKILALVSHEFRNPLAIIDSAAQRISKKTDLLVAAHSNSDRNFIAHGIYEKTDIIRKTVSRIETIMDVFIPAAITDKFDRNIQIQTQNLSSYFEDIQRRYFKAYPDIRIILAESRDFNALINPFLFDQVIDNIIYNAKKYNNGSPTIKIKITPTAEGVMIDLADNGVGIPMADQGRVFEEYYRASNVDSRPGSGLGLSIARKIMAQHGGTIELLASSEEGSTFRLRLPLPPLL